jgi:hypothetical protein
MLTLLVSQDDWFVYRVPHVAIGRQGISMLGTVGICLLTSRHVLRWISGLHHVQGDISKVSNVVPRVDTPSHITYEPYLQFLYLDDS